MREDRRVREHQRESERERERRRERERERETLSPNHVSDHQCMGSLCHPCITATHLPYRFPIFETSATARHGLVRYSIYRG